MRPIRFALVLIAGTWLSVTPLPHALAASPATKPQPPSGVSYKGGDGSACQRSVIIKGAADEAQAIEAKAKWLEWRHPGHTKVKEVTAGDCSGRLGFSSTAEGMKVGPIHDLVTITTVDGHEKMVWFDFRPQKFMFKPAAPSK